MAKTRKPLVEMRDEPLAVRHPPKRPRSTMVFEFVVRLVGVLSRAQSESSIHPIRLTRRDVEGGEFIVRYHNEFFLVTVEPFAREDV